MSTLSLKNTATGFLLFLCFHVSAEAPKRSRLSQDDLLQYRKADGTIGKAANAQDWKHRRSEIIAGMESVVGKLPGPEMRCALDVQVTEEVDCGSYVRRLITYASDSKGRAPAYLCIPNGALSGKPAPAVLCLHPTDNVIGHKVVVGLGGKPHRQYASELAERGFVTIAPSYPQLANYQPDLEALGFKSGTMKAIWDNIRALDLLDESAFAKHGSYGVIGHSLGGHNSVFVAAFDDRIKVIVSSCGLDSFRDYMGGNEKSWVAGAGWTQNRYMPALAEYRGRLGDIPFDFSELIGALAPRHVLICAPLKDSNFRWDSVDRIAKSAGEVFALHGAGANLQVEHPDSDHDFPDEMRAKAYALMEKVLK